ncbi:MAG: hypothetical protein JWO24_778 [Rhodospirillales bacterium]|nr:hypothetical protein [Rhodospirillales bacterium]
MLSAIQLRREYEAFLRGLDAADEEFRKDKRYSGRVGAMLAIKETMDFVVKTGAAGSQDARRKNMELMSSLAHLAAALGSLHEGAIAPMLKAGKANNAPPVLLLTRVVRAQMAAAADCLMQAGQSLEQATTEVARQMAKTQYATKPRSIENWRQKLRGAAANSTQADVAKYHAMLAEAAKRANEAGKARAPIALRHFALQILEDRVFGGGPA